MTNYFLIPSTIHSSKRGDNDKMNEFSILTRNSTQKAPCVPHTHLLACMVQSSFSQTENKSHTCAHQNMPVQKKKKTPTDFKMLLAAPYWMMECKIMHDGGGGDDNKIQNICHHFPTGYSRHLSSIMDVMVSGMCKCARRFLSLGGHRQSATLDALENTTGMASTWIVHVRWNWNL